MESHTLYSVLFQRLPDFRIKYDFICQNDPSPILIYQGRQFNFRYANHGDMKNSHYIIWPEFEDRGGFTILDKWAPIQASGTAKMWIVNSHLAEYHRQYCHL